MARLPAHPDARAALWLALPGAAARAAESCPGFVAQAPARVCPRPSAAAALQADEVRLTFVGHASFLIESPAASGSRLTTTISCAHP